MRHDPVAMGQERIGRFQEPHGHELRRPELVPVATDQGRAHNRQRGEADLPDRLFNLAFDAVVEEPRAWISPCCRIQREGSRAVPASELRNRQRTVVVDPASE